MVFVGNRIYVVMVGVIGSNVIDRGFESRSKTMKLVPDICCFIAKHAILKRTSKDGWLGIRIMCQSGTICLSVDCCFSELALQKSN